MNNRRLLSFALLSGVLLSGRVFAQEDDSPKLVYKARTEIDFTELEIRGELVRPSITLVSDIKRESFNFINLRADFNPEIEQSLSEVR